ENVDINVNGNPVGTVFGPSTGSDCPISPDLETLVVSASAWNAAVAGGDAVINMVPTAAVDQGSCPNSHISVYVHYPITVGDCNGNSILDVCEIASGALYDCNRNGVPDGCEIAAGLLTDSDFNGRADECECIFTCHGDFNFDSIVNGDDTQLFVNCL